MYILFSIWYFKSIIITVLRRTFMTTLNLAIDNIEVIAVETSRTIYRVSTMSVFHFTLYMKN